MTQINLPVPAEWFWAITSMAAFVFACWVIANILQQSGSENSRVEKIQSQMGLEALHPALFLFAMTIWGLLLLTLVTGLFAMIVQVINVHVPIRQEKVWDYRFSLAKLTALTAVLGAVIAIPFTIIRLRLTHLQTNTAVEALFNDKINAAAQDLAARRQVTRVIKTETGQESVLTEWKDDLVTRTAAIDRLHGLAQEQPNATPRIARLLSNYVTELSREHTDQLQEPPEGVSIPELLDWAKNLTPFRTDVEKAAQTLGRLRNIKDHGLRPEDIDLRGANLQGFDLRNANFDEAIFSRVKMQGSYLIRVKMQGSYLIRAKMRKAYLIGTSLQGANLYRAEMQGADLTGAKLQGTVLLRAKMHEVDLSHSKMRHTNLCKAEMLRAKLIGTEMDDGTYLKGVNLRGACICLMGARTVRQLEDYWQDVYADGTILLPREDARPHHWDGNALDPDEFDKRWHAWQATLPPE